MVFLLHGRSPLLLFFINVGKEIIKSPVNLDIDINGDMDRFYLQRSDLNLVAGLDLMFCAATQHHAGKKYQQSSLENHNELLPVGIGNIIAGQHIKHQMIFLLSTMKQLFNFIIILEKLIQRQTKIYIEPYRLKNTLLAAVDQPLKTTGFHIIAKGKRLGRFPV